MIKFYKQIGETPLASLNRLRQEQPEYKEAKLSYAGRLDPMAEGLMLVLVGEENNQREEFLNLDKKYEFRLLFGVKTDSFDLLGQPETEGEWPKTEDNQEFLEEIKQTCRRLEGKQEMAYPPYSSQTIELSGRKIPLWQVARAGRLDEIDLPAQEVEIYSLDCVGISLLEKNYIIYYIIKYISKLAGDFRQEEIIHSWQNVLENAPENLVVADFKLSSSSGTYVRQLSQELGQLLSKRVCVFSIKRTQVGKYRLSQT